MSCDRNNVSNRLPCDGRSKSLLKVHTMLLLIPTATMRALKVAGVEGKELGLSLNTERAVMDLIPGGRGTRPHVLFLIMDFNSRTIA